MNSRSLGPENNKCLQRVKTADLSARMKVRDDGRDAGVESNHVQHARERSDQLCEAVAGHSRNDGLGVANGLIPILPKGAKTLGLVHPSSHPANEGC